jgi:hypothetical protein
VPYEKIKDICKYDLSLLNYELSKVHWNDQYGRDGLKRASAWFTAHNCSCPYVYGGQSWPALPFETWMTDLANTLIEGLGIKGVPDAVNLNKYANKKCSLYWHSDNELIFKQDDGGRTIISLSVGATRAFWFKKVYESEYSALEVILKSGDICVMQGKTQSFWQHMIPQDHSVSGAFDDETRYNMTFRFITQHTKKCSKLIGAN